MTTRRPRTVEPKGWTRPRGYSNGVAASGETLYVAGQIGWNPRTESPTFAKGFPAQFEQALLNVVEVVQEAGGSAESIVRLTVYVTDKQQYLAALKEVGAAWRRLIGRTYPAMSLVEVKALLEDEALVEIEATAVL